MPDDNEKPEPTQERPNQTEPDWSSTPPDIEWSENTYKPTEGETRKGSAAGAVTR